MTASEERERVGRFVTCVSGARGRIKEENGGLGTADRLASGFGQRRKMCTRLN